MAYLIVSVVLSKGNLGIVFCPFLQCPRRCFGSCSAVNAVIPCVGRSAKIGMHRAYAPDKLGDNFADAMSLLGGSLIKCGLPRTKTEMRVSAKYRQQDYLSQILNCLDKEIIHSKISLQEKIHTTNQHTQVSSYIRGSALWLLGERIQNCVQYNLHAVPCARKHRRSGENTVKLAVCNHHTATDERLESKNTTPPLCLQVDVRRTEHRRSRPPH